MFEDTGDANIDLILKLVYEINSVPVAPTGL